jgi:hypothetical protein
MSAFIDFVGQQHRLEATMDIVRFATVNRLIT